MKCVKCESALHYGDKYCNVCGEKIEKNAYNEDYAKTIWGKFDKLSDKWETFTLKKFIDNWITKVLILLVVLAWGFFDAYTDYTNIKFLESESYRIEYNKKTDEYYIRTQDNEVSLNLYIPKHAEKVTVTEYKGEEKITKDLFPEDSVKVKKNDFDYMLISSVRGEKVTDIVKIYVTE